MLLKLEAHLRPTDLLSKVEALIFRNDHDAGIEPGVEDKDDPYGLNRANTKAVELGEIVAGDKSVLEVNSSRLVSNEAKWLAWSFGRGLAKGCDDPNELWEYLVGHFAAVPVEGRNASVLRGYLNGLHDRDKKLLSDILNRAVVDERVSAWYPALQVSFDLGAEDVRRLRQAVILGKAPAHMYGQLKVGRATDQIEPEQLKALVLEIADLPDGQEIAEGILSMKIHAEEASGGTCNPSTIEIGRELLVRVDFEARSKGSHDDYELGQIIGACLGGTAGAEIAIGLSQNMVTSMSKRRTYSFSHPGALGSLLAVQPLQVLDVLLGNAANRKWGKMLIEDSFQHRSNALNDIPENGLLSWCDKEPAVRYVVLAGMIDAFVDAREGAVANWTSSARFLLDNAPDKLSVLREFVSQMAPVFGSRGELAGAIEDRTQLLDEFLSDPEEEVRAFALEAKDKLHLRAEQEREWAAADAHSRDERFE